MNVVVFGASGFVGRNVVRRLAEGHKVLASDMVEGPLPEGVSFVKTDITDYESVRKTIEGSDVVAHLAASSLTRSLDSPLLNAKVNLLGTVNILEVCRDVGVKKLIYSSASSLVGDVLYNPVDEEHPAHPKTPYAVTKLASEHYIRVYNEIYGLNYLVFRFFNLYGPYQYPEGGGLVPSMFKRVLAKQPVIVFGDGSAVRDFIYVEDVAEFYGKAIEMDVKNEIVNMGTGQGSSIMDIIKAVGEITGVQPIIEYKPQRKGEISNFVADTAKLEKLFGALPRVGLRDGLQRTYEWFKAECVK